VGGKTARQPSRRGFSLNLIPRSAPKSGLAREQFADIRPVGRKHIKSRVREIGSRMTFPDGLFSTGPMLATVLDTD
jgi:hypothetical protein